MNDNELNHYGVLGMKWGRRRSQPTAPPQKRRRMSNKELQSRVKRLKLEDEYKKLTTPPKAKSKVESIVKTLGTVAAVTGSAAAIYTNLDKISKMAKAAKQAV